MALESLHEPIGEVSAHTREMRRAVASLIEELEAAHWYQQRIDASHDAELKAILAHNRDEEKEHAAMLLEWIRRNDETQAKELRNYLFTSGSIAEHEEEKTK
ncbi:MAG: ferritin [Thermoleophilia bacterium]|nr:ferritin [Thermoleophilia bacterium]